MSLVSLARGALAALVLAGAGIRAATFDLQTATLADIDAAMDAGALTSEKLVQLYLARIAAYDRAGPGINAVITLQPKALEIARALDAERKARGPRSPLHGVPVVLKDLFDTKDLPTSCGFLPMKDSQPLHDATVVKRLRDAGAIILAKTTLSEFAGGALAANFGLLALGEETSSSLKRPAAWGALAGLRPTPGLVSRAGMWDGHPVPTAQMGPMTRTVTDLALLMDGMVGYDAEDPITAFGVMHTPKSYTSYLDKNALKGARIGVIREPIGSNSRPDSEDFKKVDALFQKALADLRAAGAIVVDVVIPDLKALMAKRASDPARTEEALRVYLARNPNSQFKSREDINHHPAMATSFKTIVAKFRAENPVSSEFAGAGYGGSGRALGARTPGDPARILESQRAREQLLMNMAQAMAEQNVSALAYKAVEHQPTLIAEATQPPYKSNGGVVSLNTFLIHTPTITVPMGFTTDGIPAGLAFLGLPFSDAALIRLAYAYEQLTHHRRPPASTPAL